MIPAIAVRNLSLSYGKRKVLQDVSFSVQQGEFFIIIGPNGSGKSTLVKAISGTVRTESGCIEILGRSVRKFSRKALARLVAAVPQTQPVDIPFTAAEVVLMGRSPHLKFPGIEKPEDIRIAEEAMLFTGVSQFGPRKLDRLSTGERQRVLIARAVCQEPRVIVLDEPTASLDLAYQVHVMELMERLRRRDGTTVVMVSHDLNLAAMYADRLLLLKEGRAVGLGAPREVLTYELLEETYGCVLLVDENPVKPVPRITLAPGVPKQGSGTEKARIVSSGEEGQPPGTV